MVGFLPAVSNFLKGRVCFALGRLDDAITLAGDLVGAPDPPLNVPKALGALLCDLPPDTLQPPAPPFTGGQCPGTIYQFTWTVNQGNAPPFNGISDRPGPLTLSRALEPGDENAGCEEGQEFARYTMLSGTSPVGLGSGCGVTVTNIQVTPLFGMPDNCGDPNTELPEPGDNIEFGGDVTYEGDDNTNITVPVTGIFAPIYVDLDGSLRIPVTVNVGGIDLTGNVEVSPSFTVNLNPKGIKTGPGKPDDPSLGPGQPGVPVPEDEEEADVIVGVLVFSTLQSDAQNATGFPSVGGPTFLVPRLGSVQFAIKTGNSIGWTSDLDVKNLECYVPCPAPQGAIAVRVTPIAGVTRTFTPVRGKSLTSF